MIHIKDTGLKYIGNRRRMFANFKCEKCNTIVNKPKSEGNRTRFCSISCGKTKYTEAQKRLKSKASGAITRCTNKNARNYNRYGGRGITVYEEWKKNIPLFVSYLESLPGSSDKTLTLDRVNNDYGYEPMNLQFATESEQASNRSVVGKIKHKYIHYSELNGKINKYRVHKYKRYETLEQALEGRKEKYGF